MSVARQWPYLFFSRSHASILQLHQPLDLPCVESFQRLPARRQREEWHRAGTLERKQNVFDDFIAAGEFLVREKFTSPSRLGILGGSNGGLLVGAVTNQRPELFAAAVLEVGVLDMLRYHRLGIGYAWAGDYGTADTPEGFKYLSASPYHNIRAGVKYPAVLAMTADHDDRVFPGHTFKYTAALQAAPVTTEVSMSIEVQSSTRTSRQATEPMAPSWRKMVGIALLWFALATLVYVPPSAGSSSTPLIALLGFASFAGGLSLFADGLKRSIVAELRNQWPQ